MYNIVFEHLKKDINSIYLRENKPGPFNIDFPKTRNDLEKKFSLNFSNYNDIQSIWNLAIRSQRHSVFQGANKEFWRVNRCGSSLTFWSLPFIWLGQVASFLGFLTWDPSLICDTDTCKQFHHTNMAIVNKNRSLFLGFSWHKYAFCLSKRC